MRLKPRQDVCLIGFYFKVGAKMTADNDTDLWQKMADTVVRKPSSRAHPIDTAGAALLSKKKAKKPTKPISASDKPSAFETKQQKRPADLRIGDRAGIDRSSSKRLSQGRYEIDDQIDLHGMTQAAAHTRLRQFILRAAEYKYRTVLVVTGKGARGQGVLRQQVPIWLKESPLAPLVMAISQASGKDGGGGALYVRLRRDRTPKS